MRHRLWFSWKSMVKDTHSYRYLTRENSCRLSHDYRWVKISHRIIIVFIGVGTISSNWPLSQSEDWISVCAFFFHTNVLTTGHNSFVTFRPMIIDEIVWWRRTHYQLNESFELGWHVRVSCSKTILLFTTGSICRMRCCLSSVPLSILFWSRE